MNSVDAGMIVLRSVPPEHMEGVAKGEVKVYGSILRNIATGLVVGHLQETIGMAGFGVGLANLGLGGANLAVGATGLRNDAIIKKKIDGVQFDVSSVLSNTEDIKTAVAGVQQGVSTLLADSEVIKSGIQSLQGGVDTLLKLGLMDVALGAANLGVSAVGFAVVSAKIDGVKKAVDQVLEKVEGVSAKIDQLQHDNIAKDLADIRGLAKSFDEGWLLSADAAEKRWHQIAHELQRYQARFEERAAHMIHVDVLSYEAADPMMDALGMIGAIRVAALMACNEPEAARAAAVDNARVIERITGNIGLYEMSKMEFIRPASPRGSAGWLIAEAQANTKGRHWVNKIRQREALAITRGAPLDDLRQCGIAPRDWLELARNETDNPLIYLPAGK